MLSTSWRVPHPKCHLSHHLCPHPELSPFPALCVAHAQNFYEQQLNRAREDVPSPNLVLAASQPLPGNS